MFLVLGITLYFKHFMNSVGTLSNYFQVHPEGKFVVDVDKNIDINDVSISYFYLLYGNYKVNSLLTVKMKNMAFMSIATFVESSSGDSKLPCGSAQ